MIPGIRVLIKFSDDIKKSVEKEKKKVESAQNIALQKTSWEIQQAALDDLLHGRLDLAPLSKYQNPYNDPRFFENKNKFFPLSGLAYAKNWAQFISYKVNRQALTSDIGYILTSIKWGREVAVHHYQGDDWHYKDYYRAYLHSRGIHLRKTTTTAKVPERDIMGAVYKKYNRKALEMLKDIFERKYNGEFIE